MSSEEPDNDSFHYHMKAEPGEFAVSGSDVGGFFANTASVISESIKSPFTDSALPRAKKRTNGRKATAVDNKISVTSHFKLIFLSVLIISVLCLVGEILLSMYWDKPNPDQARLLYTLDFAFKAGFGAFIGLLGGKAS